jgi:hypothetical protein
MLDTADCAGTTAGVLPLFMFNAAYIPSNFIKSVRMFLVIIKFL